MTTIVYIYAKYTERIDVFNPFLDASGIKTEDLRFSSEHQRAWHALDDIIGYMSSGDFLCVAELDDLGDTVADRISRIKLAIGKGCGVAVCGVPSTYELGLDANLNRVVISALIQGMGSALSGQQPLVRQTKTGRPKLSFPAGWDELYAQWEKHEISSKEFLEASGLKKATFYNKLDDYKELLDANARYLAENGIS